MASNYRMVDCCASCSFKITKHGTYAQTWLVCGLDTDRKPFDVIDPDGLCDNYNRLHKGVR